MSQDQGNGQPTVSDNLGSTGWFVEATFGKMSGIIDDNSCWVAFKWATGGETTITPTTLKTGFPTSFMQSVAYWELSGCANPLNLDAVVGGTVAAGATKTTCTVPSAGSVTTTNAGDIVLGITSIGDESTGSNSGGAKAWTGTGPMTNIGTITSNGVYGSYLPGATLSAVTFTANWTTAVGNFSGMAVAIAPPGNTYYAYAASNGNWTWSSANTTNFYSGSGGTGVNGTAPTANDTVIFDSNSGTGTVTWTTGVCLNIQCLSGYTGTITGTTAISIPGSITLVSGMTWSVTGTITMTSTTVGSTITCGGNTLGALTFNGALGVFVLNDTLNCGALTITNVGNFENNGQVINCTSFASSNSNTRNITLGTVNVSGTGTVFGLTTATGLTINSAFTVNVTDTSSTAKTVSVASTVTTPTINVVGGVGSGAVTLTTGPIGALTNTNPCTISMGNTSTAITTLAINGTASNQTTLNSSTTGTQQTLVITNPATCNYCTFKDIYASSAKINATIGGVNSGDTVGINWPIGPWDLVQVATSAEATTTASAAFAVAPTTGDLIIATTTAPVTASSKVPRVTDGNGNPFALLVGASETAAVGGTAIYGYIAQPNQSKTVTATGQTGDAVYINAYEYSGNYAATNGVPSTFLDNLVASDVIGSSTGTTTGSVKTSRSNSLIIACLGLNGTPGKFPVPTGTNVVWINPTPSNSQLTDGYINVATPGTTSISFAWTTSRAYVLCWVALRGVEASAYALPLMGVG